MKGTIEKQLEEARMAIRGALANPEILSKISKFGYNQKVLQEGKALLGQIEMLISLQNEGFDAQMQATRQLRQGRKDLNTVYSRHLSMVRVALKEHPEYRKALMLQGVRKQDMAGWLGQVSAFYNHIDRVQTILTRNGVTITPEEFAQGKAMIEAIADLRVQQLAGISNKQRATWQRQEAIQALRQWMKDFLYIARYVLKDNPQQMEALGQTV